MKQTVRSRRVWIANGFRPADVCLSENGKIERVLPYGAACPEAGTVSDYGNRRVVPGFIDIHTHGAYGFDTNDAEPEGLRGWVKRIPEEGVTALLPTTVTQSAEILSAACANVAAVADAGYEGAEILGIHLEGPYFDMQFKGAQPPEAIREASVAEFCAFQEAAHGMIRYVSLAPEHDPEFALTRYCAAHGVVAAIGHSGADYETALLAAANGARSETHVFNAMSQLLHRMPGMVGAALRIRDLYGEIICDAQHVHPDVVNLFFRSKGPDYAIMVSDSLRCKLADPDMEMMLGGHKITLDENGLARLSDGTIAGSTMRMNEGLRNLAEVCGVPFDAALNACTKNPAECLGIGDRKGRICAGYDADIVVLSEEYGVEQTYCRGIAQL